MNDIVLTELASGAVVQVRVSDVMRDLVIRRQRAEGLLRERGRVLDAKALEDNIAANAKMCRLREKSLIDAGLCPQCAVRGCEQHRQVAS